MIKYLWNKLPYEEQKLISGAIVALLAAGAVRTMEGSIVVDTVVVTTVLVRYATDSIQRALEPNE
jgi:hypothetical protein